MSHFPVTVKSRCPVVLHPYSTFGNCEIVVIILVMNIQNDFPLDYKQLTIYNSIVMWSIANSVPTKNRLNVGMMWQKKFPTQHLQYPFYDLLIDNFLADRPRIIRKLYTGHHTDASVLVHLVKQLINEKQELTVVVMLLD